MQGHVYIRCHPEKNSYHAILEVTRYGNSKRKVIEELNDLRIQINKRIAGDIHLEADEAKRVIVLACSINSSISGAVACSLLAAWLRMAGWVMTTKSMNRIQWGEYHYPDLAAALQALLYQLQGRPRSERISFNKYVTTCIEAFEHHPGLARWTQARTVLSNDPAVALVSTAFNTYVTDMNIGEITLPELRAIFRNNWRKNIYFTRATSSRQYIPVLRNIHYDFSLQKTAQLAEIAVKAGALRKAGSGKYKINYPPTGNSRWNFYHNITSNMSISYQFEEVLYHMFISGETQ